MSDRQQTHGVDEGMGVGDEFWADFYPVGIAPLVRVHVRVQPLNRHEADYGWDIIGPAEYLRSPGAIRSGYGFEAFENITNIVRHRIAATCGDS